MRNCWANEPDGLSVVIEGPPTWPLTCTHSHFCFFYSLDTASGGIKPMSMFFLKPVFNCYLLPRRELYKKRNKNTISAFILNNMHWNTLCRVATTAATKLTIRFTLTPLFTVATPVKISIPAVFPDNYVLVPPHPYTAHGRTTAQAAGDAHAGTRTPPEPRSQI